MKRREFITLLGGAAAMWPGVARGQQPERVRRVSALMDTAENNPEGHARITAFEEALQALGWKAGRNIRIDVRWASGDVELARSLAYELVDLNPDVIFAYANAQLRSASQATRTIPIVFIGASDPVGAGYAGSFARPGGNITGFTLFEPSMAGKWVALLKEMAPALLRIAIMINPDTGTQHGTFYLNDFEAAVATLNLEAVRVVVRNASEIEQALAALGARRDSGLIVAPDGFTQAHDALIVSLAAHHRVPAMYGPGSFAKLGGLLSYGPDLVDPCRRAASYVHRILRGEAAAELPIQAPTKFELVINLKTAKALGLDVPPMLLARADEVIE